jgi:hypothetical protein
LVPFAAQIVQRAAHRAASIAHADFRSESESLATSRDSESDSRTNSEKALIFERHIDASNAPSREARAK